VLGIEEVKKIEAGVDPRIMKLEQAALKTGKVGWPEIKVKRGRFRNSRSVLQINGEEIRVLVGDRFGRFEVAAIGEEEDCITLVKYGPGNETEEREFCLPWPKITVKGISDATRSGDFIAILEVDNKEYFVKVGERIGEYEVQSIDGPINCVTLVNDRGEIKEFCKQEEERSGRKRFPEEPRQSVESDQETEWPEIEFTGIILVRGNLFARLEVDNERRSVQEGEHFGPCFLARINTERKCVTVTKPGPDNKIEEREFCKE
jgi:hypothetical protein